MLRKILFAFFTFCIFLTGCQKNEGQQVIGIVQAVEHPTLNTIYKGIIDQIIDCNSYLEEPIEVVDLEVKNGEIFKKNSATQLENDAIDLILAISSQSLHDLYQVNNTVPIIFTAVSDMGLLKKSNNMTENILTGVSDMIPVESQIKLLSQILPDLNTIGVIYNPAEKLSLSQIELIKESSSKNQFDFIFEEVASSEDAINTAKNLLGEIDALYIPSDLTVTPVIQSILTWTDLAGKPIISGDERGIEQGALCTVIVDYYKLGQQTGKIAVDGLTKVISLEEHPIEMSKHNKLLINTKSAEKLNIVIPYDLMEAANLNK